MPLLSDQQHVWMVRKGPGSLLLPVTKLEVAETFRKAGWQVTELPIAAFSEDEAGLRCLGIGPEEASD